MTISETNRGAADASSAPDTSVVASASAVGQLGPLRAADAGISLRRYLGELWSRRDYIRFVAGSELRSQQMNTVLGNVWHVLNPALQIGVFYLIFGVVLGVNRGVDNLLAFITVGLFSYQFSTKSVTAGAKSITANRAILRSVWFPRAMLPVTTTFTQFLSFLPMLVIMPAICLVTGEPVRVTWLLVPAIIALQLTLNLGLAFFAARAASHIPDVQQLLPYVFRMLLYASGVIFLVDEYVENSSYRLLFELNPFYGIVSLWRWAVLDYDINSHVLGFTSAVAVVSLIAGFLWFRRGEQSYTHEN
ncbi:MAG: ABC transporter permease [Actinomycetota bacterium]